MDLRRSELRPRRLPWKPKKETEASQEPSRWSTNQGQAAPVQSSAAQEGDLDYWQSQGKKLGEVASALGAGWQLQISSLSMGTGTVIAICAVAVASVSGTFVALTAALRPALKAMEESCEALQVAAESVERAAVAMERDLPQTLADVDKAAVEFTELGQELRAIASGLSGLWAQNKRKGKQKQGSAAEKAATPNTEKNTTSQWPWKSSPGQTGEKFGSQGTNPSSQQEALAGPSAQPPTNSTALDLWDEEAGVKNSLVDTFVGDFRRRIGAAIARRRGSDRDRDERRMQARSWIARWRKKNQSTLEENDSPPVEERTEEDQYQDDIDEYVEEYERRIRQDAALVAVGEAIAAAEEVARDAMTIGRRNGDVPEQEND